MKVTLYGITGYRELTLPLDDLDIEELETGSEFVYRGTIYEIRSINEREGGLMMNVVVAME